MLLCSAAMAQNAVTGKVTDAKDGSPVSGVTVSVKGTTAATQTVADGTFKINVPANATLVFTYVGFTTQQVAVAGKTVIDISFVQANQQLNEVVVVAYGSRPGATLPAPLLQFLQKIFKKETLHHQNNCWWVKCPGWK